MRCQTRPFEQLRRLGALAFIAASLGLAAPASAGSLFQDEVHADSFGNLVIYSPAGYKRIVVGKGHLAAEMQQYGDAGEEFDDGDVRPLRGPYVEYASCRRAGVLLHGRSFMYGLPSNVVPVLQHPCH
ncbi:hypothetical protein [Mesorhizobium xinjiangense]|uniref:hypothetical protein n=1 Tax=Mesorhizobium xinjiangense TaxID=2678685 RepID=UPI0012EDA0A7|nr:hypothetical protein [Mesorhizobium xinjiangense]